MTSRALPDHVVVERLNGGLPILSPQGTEWESGVTFNTAAIRLERSAANDPIIRGLLGRNDLSDLPEGVVVLNYRARPATDPGFENTRSYMGVAVYTPTLELLRRLPQPVMSPEAERGSFDELGVEDARITRIGNTFHAIYCGVARGEGGHGYRCAVCHAESTDLLNWTKHGPVAGDVNGSPNKNGVLFPGAIGGKYYLLHRPMVGGQSDFVMRLATAESLRGPWRDLGILMKAAPVDGFDDSWLGPGSVPIPLGADRFLVVYHLGNLKREGFFRRYDLAACIMDFRKLDPAAPAGIVGPRIEPLMTPATRFEIEGPFPESVANVLFTCGSYVHGGDLYIHYGGGDSFIMAARVDFEALVGALEYR